MRIDRPPLRRAQRHAGKQRHFGVGGDDRQFGAFAGGDHLACEIVMPDIVQHHNIELPDALDILGTRLISVRIETGVNERHHPGTIPHDVGDKAVVRVQGNADVQIGGVYRQRGESQQGEEGQTAKTQGKRHDVFQKQKN